MALPTLLFRLSKVRPAARSRNPFWRFALFVSVIGVMVFVSIGTASAHIDSLKPNQWTAGGPAFTLRILGRDFDASDKGRVLFNGTRVADVVLINPRELQATIPASLVSSPGTVRVTLEGFPGSVDFTINLSPNILNNSLARGFLGQPYSQRLDVSGGTAPFTWSGTDLPPGLSVSTLALDPFSFAGVISGTPTVQGTFNNVRVKVTDAAGVIAEGTFSLRVNADLDCLITLITISPTSRNLPATGSASDLMGTVTVTTSSGCYWEAESDDSWITIIRASGTGNGTATYSVAVNSGAPRIGTFSIEGQTFTVNQEGQCSVLILPESRVFDSDFVGIPSINVYAPPDCEWTVRVTAGRGFLTVSPARSPTGNGSVSYQIPNPNSGPARLGTIFVGGRTHTVVQNASSCIGELICRVFPSACAGGALSLSRRFRDEALAKTPRGQRYTKLYYQFSSEAVQIVMLNPMLILRSRDIFERYKPVIESMVKGEPVALTQGDIAEIDGFLNTFAAKGSAELRETLKGLCEDLRDTQLHTEFNITITEGPKRQLPAQGTLQNIKQTGMMIAPLGLLLFCIYRVGPRRKDAKGVLKRLISVAVVLWLVGGQWSVGGETKKLAFSRPLSTSMKRDKPVQGSDDHGDSPLTFEANQGQTDPQVKFITRTSSYNLFLTQTEAVMKVGNQKSEVRNQNQEATEPTPDVLRMKLIGANPAARIEGLGKTLAVSNYFGGKDSAKWRANVPTYSRVTYGQIYHGVDIVYYGNRHDLEYDFKVAPGCDPAQIRLGFEGAESIEIDSNGDLVLGMPGGDVRQRKPIAYQEVNGKRRAVDCRYRIRNQVVDLDIGAYDVNKLLIIDPLLAYSTYFGGGGNEEGNSIAVDRAGNVYLTGFTDSINFPLANASQPNLGGGQQDAFVVKLDPSGTRVVYSTYIGGNGQDNATSIAVDGAGNAYITGFTDSTNFPVRNAMQPAKRGDFNSFVVKLDPAGSMLNSTLFGGSVNDYASGIAVDSSGNVYIAGIATSPDLPTANAIQPQPGGLVDIFVAKIDPSGNRLLYSTYLGGIGIEGASSIAVDSTGNVYLTGLTSSPNFRTVNALKPTHGGGVFDAFVVKLNPSGTGIIYSTYLGGTGEDRAFRIAVDTTGNAYVTGDTDSTNFPVTNAAQRSNGGSADAFVAKLNASGSQLLYSTYLGGSGIDGGTAIAVDSAGSALVIGFTASTDFPTVNPLRRAFGGTYDGFVVRLNAEGSALDYSTYLGGSGIDSCFGIAVDASGNAYLMGVTDSLNLPMAAPFQPAYGGGVADVFVAKIKSGPTISRAEIQGKHLLVFGSGFDTGAKILLDGEVQAKTRNDEVSPTGSLFGKKVGKNIASGQTVTLQVRNSDGALSNELRFTRP